MKTTNFEKKKIMPLINEEYKSYLNQTSCHICKKKVEDKCTNDKNDIVVFETTAIIQVNIEVLDIAYVV